MSMDYATADFGMRAYQHMATLNESTIFSPFSILMALSMTYLGSSGNTKEQMKSNLFFGNVTDEQLEKYMAGAMGSLSSGLNETSYQLYVANRMFGDQSLHVLTAFKDAIKTYFSGDLVLLPFAETEKALKQVNDWVKTETKGKIENLLSPDAINPLTRLILVNAIYFKSNWRNPFSMEHTTPMAFYTTENGPIEVSMMYDKRNFLYAESDDLQVLGIPYSNEALTMYAFLPKGKSLPLKQVMSKISGKQLLDLANESRERQVEVFLPKFKVERECNVKAVLQKLGVVDLFEMEKADLSKITGTRSLFVSGAFHKAFIEVNEKGSEAAAATAVVSMLRSISISVQPLVFKADHPFLYIIMDDEKKTVLFVGDYHGQSSQRKRRSTINAM